MLAACLHQKGLHPDAYAYLQDVKSLIEDEVGEENYILMKSTEARLEDCLSKYEDSEKSAKEALKRASELLSRNESPKAFALAIRAKQMVSSMHHLQSGSLIPYQYQQRKLYFSPRLHEQLILLLKDVTVLFAMKRLLSHLARPGGALGELWRAQAWYHYINHKLNILQLIRRAGRLRLIPKRIGGWLQALTVRAVNEVGRQSDEYGYAGGIAGSHRFSYIAGYSGKSAEEAKTFYILLNNPLNLSLTYRDIGDSCLKKDPPDITGAKEAFQKSYRFARSCGSSAMMLKALIGLYVAGEAVDSNEILALARACQGKGYRRLLLKLERVFNAGS
jgi:hypothetical protein